MTTASIEPRPAFPPDNALWRYRDAVAAAGLEYEQYRPAKADRAAAARLSDVEKGTCRVRIITQEADLVRGLIAELGARLRVWDERGVLRYMSGDAITRTWQYLWWPGAPWVRPLAGWAALGALDADLRLGIEVTISSLNPDDPFSYRRVRLHQRLRELRHG